MPHQFLRTIALTATVLVALTGAPAGAVAAELSSADAEAHLLALVNRSRTAAGLVAVRLDARLGAIARARSADMIARDYYAHETPDGRDVFADITDAGIRWFAAGENLGANSFPSITDSAAMVSYQWLESPGHRAVLLGRAYNYVGIGFAVSGTGRKIWTAVFMRGPDRTKPWAKASRVTKPSASQVRFTWSGADVRLSSLTAGLRDFQIQRRRDGGSWAWVTTSTTSTGRTMNVTRGHRYEFRVRARDRVGNASGWTLPLAVTT